MKKCKLCGVLLIFCIFIFTAQSGYSYTAYFAVDSSIALSFVDGIDAAVIGVNPLTDLTLEIFYSFEGGAVPGVDLSSVGLPPFTSWDGFLTTYGANISTSEFAPLEIADQLIPGIAFSLSSVDDFAVDRFELFSSEAEDGKYFSLYQYNILTESTEGGIIYTASQVPIPPALLLFGSGLIGLVGLRRKIKK
jgi:hypothetical protein